MKRIMLGLLIGLIVGSIPVTAKAHSPKYKDNQSVWVIDCGFDTCTWWPGKVNFSYMDSGDRYYFVSYKAKNTDKNLDVAEVNLRNRNQAGCQL